MIALTHLRTLLIISVLLFFSIPKTALAVDNCSLDKIYKDAVHYDPCNVGANSACSASATLSGSSNEEKIWNFLSGQGLKPVAAAGVMGNFFQENSFYDPARKQSDTMKALPPKGDGSTGYGIAQWTSQGRQALLFAEIDKANLSQYYGAGWGNAEKDKDIPGGDVDKLLNIELNFAWSGDTTKIKDIADQLNSATSTKGNDGSAALFHKLYERSGDDASQIQERIDSATDILQKYAGTGEGSSGSCSTGQLGGVSSLEDAIPWAMKFVTDTQAKYHPGGRDLGQQKNADGTMITLYNTNDGRVGDGSCWGATYCGQCTALSGWFVTTMTDYTYGNGNGSEVVSNLKAKGVPTGNQPKPYSVFSYDTSSNGHTGVVLGILGNGDVITMENNWPDHNLVVRRYNLKKSNPDVRFAYVGDKLKSGVLNATQ